MKKAMSPLDYMKKKNKILFDITGKWLIPKDQLMNVEARKLGYKDSDICPYCLLYLEDGCKECPMCKAGNRCVFYSSTYGKIRKEIVYHFYGIPKIVKLVKKYNKQFK